MRRVTTALLVMAALVAVPIGAGAQEHPGVDRTVVDRPTDGDRITDTRRDHPTDRATDGDRITDRHADGDRITDHAVARCRQDDPPAACRRLVQIDDRCDLPNAPVECRLDHRPPWLRLCRDDLTPGECWRRLNTHTDECRDEWTLSQCWRWHHATDTAIRYRLAGLPLAL